MNRTRTPLLLLSFLLATGCAHATIRKAASLEANPPQRIVVMPPDPGAAPPEAALFVRNIIVEDLTRRGYQVTPNEQVDGAVEPGAAAQQVAQAVPADAVLYTRITQYSLEKTVFNTETTFGVMFTMIDASGQELWVASSASRADSAGRSPVRGNSLAAGVIGLAVDAANAQAAAERPPFAEVATWAVDRSLRELPKGPLAR